MLSTANSRITTRKTSMSSYANCHCCVSNYLLITLTTVIFLHIVTGKPFRQRERELELLKEPLSEGTYFYSDYKLPPNLMSTKLFIPLPPNCPDTGKTLCKEVDQYPTETILEIVNHAKTANFNFSSIFVDESINDIEPKLDSLILNSMKTIDKGANPIQSKSQLLQRGLNITTKTGLVSASSKSSSQILGSLSKHLSTNYTAQGSTSNNGSVVDEQQSRIKRKSQNHPNDSLKLHAEEMCKIKTIYITPKVALNDRSEWKYIVNVGDRDPRLRQVIKVDICLNANKPCSTEISLPFGYKTRCKQKYIKKKLLALDVNGLGTSTENFFVPSCCACEILRVR